MAPRSRVIEALHDPHHPPTTRVMSTKQYQSFNDYYQDLAQATPINIMLWKTLKGVLEALLLILTAHLAVTQGADPNYMYAIAIIGGIAMMVGEVKEVQIANLATFTLFKNNHPPKIQDDHNED